jgi:hypothetical protein
MLLTCGTDKHIAIIQIPSTNLTARDSLDMVWDKNGLHIATYLQKKGKRKTII